MAFLIYTPTEETRFIPSAGNFFETAKKKLPSYSDESFISAYPQQPNTPPTQAAVDRQTYPLALHMWDTAPIEHRQSLCDHVMIWTYLSAQLRLMWYQTDIRTVTSFLPGRMGTTSAGSSSFR